MRISNAPDTLIFFITDRCNMRCAHCFNTNHNNKADELSLQEITRMAASLKGRIKSVIVTGGEPTIREDLPDVLSALARNGVKHLTVATNGYLSDKIADIAKQFVMEHQGTELSIQLSLDGFAQLHDKVRVTEHSHAQVMETISRLRKIPEVNIIVNTVVSKYNHEDFFEFYKDMAKMPGIQFSWHFARQDSLDVYGIDKKCLRSYSQVSGDILPDEETCEALCNMIKTVEGDGYLSEWRTLTAKYHLRVSKEGKRCVGKCVAPQVGGVLFSNGDIGVCEVLSPVANIRDYDMQFLKAWKGKEMEKQRSLASKCYCTYICNLMASMFADHETVSSIVCAKKANTDR